MAMRFYAHGSVGLSILFGVHSVVAQTLSDPSDQVVFFVAAREECSGSFPEMAEEFRVGLRRLELLNPGRFAAARGEAKFRDYVDTFRLAMKDQLFSVAEECRKVILTINEGTEALPVRRDRTDRRADPTRESASASSRPAQR